MHLGWLACFLVVVMQGHACNRYGLLDDSDDDEETEAKQQKAVSQPGNTSGKQAAAPQQPGKPTHGYGFIDDDDDMGDTDDASDQTGTLR